MIRLLLVGVTLFATGCEKGPSIKSPQRRVLTGANLTVRALPSEGGIERYQFEQDSGKEVARFEVQLEALRAQKAGSFDMEFGKGAFLSVPGSASTTLIANLCRILEAVPCPAVPPQRVSRLEFEVAILGRNLSRGKPASGDQVAGGFADSPRGNWTTMKLFLGSDGEEQGEVYLNINAKAGVGEFSLKDSGYGVAVMKQLVQVL